MDESDGVARCQLCNQVDCCIVSNHTSLLLLPHFRHRTSSIQLFMLLFSSRISALRLSSWRWPVSAGGTAAAAAVAASTSVPDVAASSPSAICCGRSTATGTRTASSVRAATVASARSDPRSSPRQTCCSADEIISGTLRCLVAAGSNTEHV